MDSEARRNAAAHQPGDDPAGRTGGKTAQESGRRSPAVDVMDATQESSHTPARQDRATSHETGAEAGTARSKQTRKPVSEMTEEDLKVPDREIKKGGVPIAGPLNTSGADDEHW